MSINLNDIETNVPKAPRIVIYGPEGIGKTTIASKAEKAIFVLCGTEDGLGDIDVKHFPLCKTFDDVIDCCAALGENDHEYKTLVVDTLDSLEPLVWAETCRRYGVDSIERVLKGWGKGYGEALDDWRLLLACFTALRDEKGMTIILLAHSITVPVKDPEHPEYDCNTLNLQKKAAQLIIDYADIVGYASMKVFTKTEGEKDAKRTRVIPTHQRILRLTLSPAFKAKNRYHLKDEIPLEWAALEEGLPKGAKPKPARKPRQVKGQTRATSNVSSEEQSAQTTGPQEGK